MWLLWPGSLDPGSSPRKKKSPASKEAGYSSDSAFGDRDRSGTNESKIP
jgi:hypothetical protein